MEKKHLLAGAIAFGVGVLGSYLWHQLSHKQEESSLSFDKNLTLTKESLLELLEEIQCKLPSSILMLKEEFKQQRLRYFRKQELKYQQTISDYLTKQKEAVKQTIQNILQRYKLDVKDFDRAIAKYENDPQVKTAFQSLIFESSQGQSIPLKLTPSKFERVLKEYLSIIEQNLEQDTVRMEIKAHDFIWKKYGFTNRDIANAKLTYQSLPEINTLISKIYTLSPYHK